MNALSILQIIAYIIQYISVYIGRKLLRAINNHFVLLVTALRNYITESDVDGSTLFFLCQWSVRFTKALTVWFGWIIVVLAWGLPRVL